jgi:hypothetical protein
MKRHVVTLLLGVLLLSSCRKTAGNESPQETDADTELVRIEVKLTENSARAAAQMSFLLIQLEGVVATDSARKFEPVAGATTWFEAELAPGASVTDAQFEAILAKTPYELLAIHRYPVHHYRIVATRLAGATGGNPEIRAALSRLEWIARIQIQTTGERTLIDVTTLNTDTVHSDMARDMLRDAGFDLLSFTQRAQPTTSL